MPVWVSDLPIWLLALILIGLGVGLALGGLVLVRRYLIFRWKVDADDSEFSGAMFQGILVFYGLAVALIAVAVWQQHDDVAAVASSEAAAIADHYRDVGMYPEPERSQAHEILRRYVAEVIERDWPAAASGSSDVLGTQIIDELQALLGGFEPATAGQEAIHAEALDSFNEVVNERRLRLDAVDDSLPAVIWAIVLGGAALAIASSYFFQVEDIRLHATLVGILGAFISIILVLIAGHERPFVGDLGVKPDSYQLVLDTLMARGG